MKINRELSIPVLLLTRQPDIWASGQQARRLSRRGSQEMIHPLARICNAGAWRACCPQPAVFPQRALRRCWSLLLQVCSRRAYLVAGLVMLALVTGWTGTVQAGIASTKHNLSVDGLGTVKSIDETEICVFCHTPHRAIKNDNIPLWNHNLSTAGNYGVYTSPTFDGAATIQDLGGTDATTAAVSNLCLSCHDGTVAINALNNPSNANLSGNPTMGGTNADGTLPDGTAMLGTDLTDDHPVNFIYDSALFAVDNSLNDPATLTGVILFNGTVQCASCHDPHNSENPAFLRISNTGSALCLRCHNK